MRPAYNSPEAYPIRRRNALYRLRKLRELQAPALVVRQEQMLLWGLRQLRAAGFPKGKGMSELPNWAGNERKFIEIHRTGGMA